MVMLHPGNIPRGSNMIPSPAVEPKFEMPAIRVNRFFTKYKEPRPLTEEEKKSQPSGTQAFLREEHWVEWVKIGDQNATTCIEAVKRLMPAADGKTRIEWFVVGPAYEAWCNNQEAPLQGQALFAWSGVSRELAEELGKNNIKTVEDLASYPDHRLNALPIPGLREIRRRAQQTIEARDINDVGAELAVRDEEIARLKREAKESEARVNALAATVEALSKNAGIAANQLTAGIPHPDDEFVQPGPNDSPAGNSRRGGNGRPSRRAPVDHIDAALGDVTGEHIDLGGKE